ncbi:MAG: hypothetical protein WBO93_08895 [Gammaproteobacteria bacterium]
MKIEILEQIKHGRDVFEPGEVRIVPADVGELFCRLGWANDTDGKIPTGERDTSKVSLVPDNVMHAQTAGDANG